MRTSSRLAAVALVALVAVAALGVAGCTPDASSPKPPATATGSPLFASDEEALAAAEEAYAAYLAVSDAITAEGGKDVERIDEHISDALREDAHASLNKFRERKLHTTGSSAFDTTSVQQISGNGDGTTTVAIYVCLDIGEVRLISLEGTDVTPVDRVNRLPLSVSFVSTEKSSRLLIEESESWQGDNFCG